MNNLKEQLNEIIKQWYKDGLATWSYSGAGDGVDGKFGGSFHDRSELQDFDWNDRPTLFERSEEIADFCGSRFDESYVDIPTYKLSIDFGSSDNTKAFWDLQDRLEQSNLPFEVRDLDHEVHSTLYFYQLTEDEIHEKKLLQS